MRRARSCHAKYWEKRTTPIGQNLNSEGRSAIFPKLRFGLPLNLCLVAVGVFLGSYGAYPDRHDEVIWFLEEQGDIGSDCT